MTHHASPGEPAEVWEELERLLYAVTHDLRSPVQAVEGFSAALLESSRDKLDATALRHAQKTHAAGQRLRSMIEGLAQLGRVARAPLHPEDIDLTQMARVLLKERSDREPQRAVRVEVEEGLHVRADAALTRMLLECLVDNAWKFSAQASPALIAIGASRAGTGRELFVRDNGVGFDPSQARRLCTPFQRFHSEKEFPGLGVGLAVAHYVTRRHGGTLRVESSESAGTTVFFRLDTTS